MSEIQPIGSNESVGSPNLGVQTFLGLTVVDFNCSCSWGGQGPDCNITLIQDPELNQYLETVVVGSPQYFEIVDLDNNPIFRFYGILSSINRSVTSNSKTYTVKLEGPARLLESAYVVTDKYAGYGGAYEAIHPNVPACLDFGSKNVDIDPSYVFNILNAYGVYENDTYGLVGAGFGKSAVNSEGMRIDFYAYAVDQLVNGASGLTPALGSNIIFGADAYTSNNAYHYNFDINGFLTSIVDYIPNDYRVRSSNLFDFVRELCELINHDFILDLLKPSGTGSQYFAGSNHVTQQTPTATHNNTIYGGQIRVITQNRNKLSSVQFPLARTIIAREASDKLGGDGQTDDLPLDMGLTGGAHPDGPPVASSPFGGEFPYEEINGTQASEVYSDTNISVELNNGTLAKYVIGGYQSRINLISRTKYVLPQPEIVGSTCAGTAPVSVDSTSNIMCYWGSIKKRDSTGKVVRDIPVITPYLDSNPATQYLDIVAIDLSDVLGTLTISGDGQHNGAIYNGIYLASVLEIRAAMGSYDTWRGFMSWFKNGKLQAIVESVNEPYKKLLHPVFHKNGNLTEYGRTLLNGQLSTVSASSTSSNDIGALGSCSVNTTAEGISVLARQITIENIFKNIHAKLKEIGDTHYGKTFAVKMPAYAIKVDAEDTAPLNSYIKSWDISDDGYLDPINYASFEAPQSNLFVSNGRLSCYANFDHGFTVYEFNDTGLTFISNTNISLDPRGGDKKYFDFSQYTLDEVTVHSPDGVSDIVSVKPQNLNKDYLLIPSSYFENYGPSVCTSWYFALNADPTINQTQTRKEFINLNNEAIQGVSYLLNQAGLDDAGIGSNTQLLPFAIITIKPVFLNAGQNESDRSLTLNQLLATVGASCNGTENAKESSSGLVLSPMMIMPRSFGVPQQSNRYVYGPWTTNITATYGGKIEYEQIDDLVPENYIIPSNLNIGGSSVSVDSGYAGMNTAGQLIANTIANFDFLFTEAGSVTIPGLPKVEYIGDTLVDNGPIVTDVQVNVSVTDIQTRYNMSGFAPKFDKANEYILNRLKKISSLAKR